VLRDPGNHAVHLPWLRKVGPRLDAIGFERSLLWHLIPGEPHYLPDFLTPAPGGLTPDLDAELALVRDTPAEMVRADLHGYVGVRTAPVRDLYERPETGMGRLVDEIAAYWQVALAKEWPRIRIMLDAEVFARARSLAEHGAAGLLNDLHEKVRWEGNTLAIEKRHCTAADVADGGGLVLIPSVFVWPSVLSVPSSTAPQLAYPTRGIAALWECTPSTADTLSTVIGRSRAQLLVHMRAPASTTELARRIGISAGGVSQHLAVLRAAGLVITHRHGKTVLNTRSSLAEALLSAAS
jgi:biotin operon repressor